jgi:protein-S-isoprenylcysteine O-methyltransferase
MARRRGTGWFLAGYAGLAAFFALEASARQPGTASELGDSGHDAGSTRGIAAAFSLAACSAPPLRRTRVGPLPPSCGPIGLAVLGAGIALRTWSMRTLSASYTRTLRVTNEQGVVDRGPYRHVRHPGYAGSLLIWLGFALTSCSLPVLGTVGVLLLPAYAHRISAEEALLARDLGGYADYQARTKKLVPSIW